MPIPHLLLALGVMAIWGTNFVTMRWVLDEVTPLTFASLRFFLVSLPLIFFIHTLTTSNWLLACRL